jgi:hypothetical protein
LVRGLHRSFQAWIAERTAAIGGSALHRTADEVDPWKSSSHCPVEETGAGAIADQALVSGA